MIIVEGPDGSGKSTLAKMLGGRVLHSGGPSTTQEELLKRVKRLSEDYREGDVIDRFPYLSEIVYRQPPIIEPILLLAMWEAFREKHHVCLIYCRTDPRTMYKNISNKAKEHKSAEHLKEVKSRYYEIVSGYDELFSIIKPTFTFDWQKDDLPCVD